MKSRTHQQWRELFKQQADGNLSVAAFCKAHKIGQSYFYKRKSDLKIETKDLPSNFIKVKPPTKNHVQAQSIKIQYKQTRLSIPPNISASWLADFVKALA